MGGILHRPGSARDFTHGGGIVHPESLHEIGEDVPGGMADVAVVQVFLGDDGEVAMSAPVEGAGSAVIRSHSLELHRFTNDADEIGAVPHLFDNLVRDHAHSVNSTMVTPVPPWLAGAKPNLEILRSLATTRRTRSRTTPVPIP
jgi:hypothetical protein